MPNEIKNNAISGRRLKAYILLVVVTLILYVIIQLAWGTNLYKAYEKDEKQQIDLIFSEVLADYAYDILSQEVSNPSTPSITIRMAPEGKQKEATDSTFLNLGIYSPEQITTGLENIFIIKGLYSDSLFFDNISEKLSREFIRKDITAFTLSLEASEDSFLNIYEKRSLQKKRVLFNYSQIITEKYEADGQSYSLELKTFSPLPRSLFLVFGLFILGTLVLGVILFLLIRLSKDLSKERSMAIYQQRYFFGLVHDLKLPLAMAHSLMDGVQNDLLTKEIDDIRGKIIEADEYVLKLTDNVQSLLLLKRAKNTELSDPKTCFLNDLLEDIENELIAYYPKKEFRLEYDFPNDTTLFLPEEELRVILRILMDNAVKYNNHHEPFVSISATNIDNTIAISVKDNGPGIEIGAIGKEQKVTWNWLANVSASSGNGIGLMTAWTLTNAMKGFITYQQRGEGGSIFTLTLPTISYKDEKNNVD